jgi:hypothetical protein
VIDRIDDGFFDSVVREVFDTGCFGSTVMLDDGFGNQVALDVIERVAGHAGYRAFEYLFREFVAARPFLGKPDDVDLHGGEEAPRFRIEHHEADIERKRRFLRPADDAHLATEFDQRKIGRLPGQIAAHPLQIVLHQFAGEIFHFCLLVDAVIVGERWPPAT